MRVFYLRTILFQEKESKEESVAELKEKSSQQTQDVGTFVEPADIAKTLLESSSVSDVSINLISIFSQPM